MLLVPLSEMRLDGLAPQGRHFPSSNVHTAVLIRHLVTTQSSTHEVLGRGGRPECSQVMLMLLVWEWHFENYCTGINYSSSGSLKWVALSSLDQISL